MTFEALLLVVAFGYLGLLFVIAAWADQRAKAGRSVIGSPLVYTLSIAVYCSAWTFYGSVGRAAQYGPAFLTIYLGPTLVMLLGWLLIRRMVLIARAQRITSIADFISARYGKSGWLGALVTLIAVIGIMPYIALQLKAITYSYAVVTQFPDSPVPLLAEAPFWTDKSLWVALVLSVFIILFGTRQLDASERHEGMVTAIAFESVIKLLAFCSVGLFVVFWLFDGPGDLLNRAAQVPGLAQHFTLDAVPGGAIGWVSTLVLAALAFLTLPRQFQVLVVENVDERHIRRACWLFPLYLLVINLFVLPIALAGTLLGESAQSPDSFVLTVGLVGGSDWLPGLAFIGGLSAATGMMIVETIALSTMVSNHLIMPMLLRMRRLHLESYQDFSGALLGIRRIAIVLILLLGYLYHALIGESYSLVTIGLVSFTAAAQFAPALLIGLYWRGAARLGAAAGMLGGFAVWLHTLLLPGFAQSGWLDASLLTDGPWGIHWLRPYALFGLEGWDIYSHGLFWSLLVNVGLLLGVSLFCRQSQLEQTQAALFTGALHEGQMQIPLWRGQTSLGELRRLLHRYLGAAATARILHSTAQDSTAPADDATPAPPQLVREAEHALAGALGGASARILINSVVRGEALDLEAVLSLLDTTSQTLEYNRQLEQKSSELAAIGAELRHANEQLRELDRLKDEFVAMVSHELRTPLTSIRAFAEILRDTPDMDTEQRSHFLSIVVRESERLSRLIEEILDLARLESGRMTLKPQWLDLTRLARESAEAVSHLCAERGLSLELDLPDETAPVTADPDRLQQVIINLLDNASKFAAPNAGKARLCLEPYKQHWRLSVEDNGEGITESERERVFEKFHQLENNDQNYGKRPRGTGLGLPISRGIIAHLGGRLWIESGTRLSGARFVIELPRAPERSADTEWLTAS
ncbi:sodium:solute symporter family transporter [Marinobacterium rhizophilum]|uniref:sodium:solute symporter family transporter n=1 Tax=Marinobacterium rhizophilum TaxID=420402 RepID=UPI00036CFD73|nr:ATP-binding protein [Marinobacterium rhizophilum]